MFCILVGRIAYLMASKAHYQVPGRKKSRLMEVACRVRGARVAEAEGRLWGFFYHLLALFDFGHV